MEPAHTREELRRLRDEAEIAEARAREAAPSGPPVPHNKFMAQLDAEIEQEAFMTRSARIPPDDRSRTP